MLLFKVARYSEVALLRLSLMWPLPRWYFATSTSAHLLLAHSLAPYLVDCISYLVDISFACKVLCPMWFVSLLWKLRGRGNFLKTFIKSHVLICRTGYLIVLNNQFHHTIPFLAIGIENIGRNIKHIKVWLELLHRRSQCVLHRPDLDYSRPELD